MHARSIESSKAQSARSQPHQASSSPQNVDHVKMSGHSEQQTNTPRSPADILASWRTSLQSSPWNICVHN
jgi:hypothetical protein